MSSSPALLDPADRANSTQRSQRDEDAQYYRAVLHKFIAMGTDLAEAVHRQALAEPAAATQSASQSQPEDAPAAPNPSPSQAITFDRLARTVRRTIALARKLSEPAREAPGPKLRLNECPLEKCQGPLHGPRRDKRPQCRAVGRAVRAPRGTRLRRRRRPWRRPRRRPRRAVARRPHREPAPRHRSRPPDRRRALAALHTPGRAPALRPRSSGTQARPVQDNPTEARRPAPDPRPTPARPARHRSASTLIRFPGHDRQRPGSSSFQRA